MKDKCIHNYSHHITYTPVLRKVNVGNSGLNKDDFAEKVDLLLGNSINDGTYQFAIKAWRDLFLNNHPKGSLDSLCQNLILRKLYKNIKRIYGIGQSNRNLIVKQMVSLLIDGSHKWIIRLDIRIFMNPLNAAYLWSVSKKMDV